MLHRFFWPRVETSPVASFTDIHGAVIQILISILLTVDDLLRQSASGCTSMAIRIVWMGSMLAGLCTAADRPLEIAIMSTIYSPSLGQGYRPVIDLAMDYLRRNYESRFNFTQTYLMTNFLGEPLPDDGGRVIAEYYYKHASTADGQALLAPCAREQLDAVQFTKPIRLCHICSVGNGVNLTDNPQHISMSFYSGRSMLEMVVELLSVNDWTSVTTMIEKESFLNEPMHRGMHQMYQEAFVGPTATYQTIRYTTFEYDLAHGDKEIETTLIAISKGSRVIFLFGSGTSALRVLKVADSLGMTKGDYVFIQTILEQRGFDLTSKNDNSWRVTDANAKMVIPYRAYVGNASLLLSFNLQLNETLIRALRSEMLAIGAQKYNFPYRFNQVYTFFYAVYDQFLLYGLVLNESYAETGRIVDGVELAAQLRNRTFNLPTGQLYINQEGERMCDINGAVHDPSTNDYTPAFRWDYRQRRLTINEEKLRVLWPGGNWPPPNEPLCGYIGNRCIEDKIATETRIGAVTVVLVCLVIIAVTVSARKRSYYAKINGNWWRVDHAYAVAETTLHHVSRSSVSGALSLVGGCNSAFLHRRMLILNRTGDVLWKTALRLADPEGKFLVTPELLRLLANLDNLHHPNINRFMGIRTVGLVPFRLELYCKRGSLDDLLDTWIGDVDMMISIIADLVDGLLYLHHSDVKFHGNLKSSKCLLDAQFGLKISDIGDRRIAELTTSSTNWKKVASVVPREEQGMVWTAPEVLRGQSPEPSSDIYAFAIIMSQVLTHHWPFEQYNYSEQEIVYKLHHVKGTPLRPMLTHTSINPVLQGIIESCWSEQPSARPQFPLIKRQLADAMNVMEIQQDRSLFDRLTHRLECYFESLENTVAERTAQLLQERQRCDEILGEILPGQVMDLLRAGKAIVPEQFEEVTISFSDIVGFVEFVEKSSPLKVLEFLHTVYSEFDQVIRGLDVYKVETIGDCYVVASGLPIRNGTRHAKELCQMAIAVLNHFSLLVEFVTANKMALRTGINTGPVAAGIVGLKSPRYCLFGDTVNTASRMQSHGAAGKIHLSPTTAEAAQQFGFVLESRGPVEVKGKGMIMTYWLISSPTVR